mgnify:FL=1
MLLSPFTLALQIPLIKMSNRKTAGDVHADLKSHEAKCEERWKSIFKETAEIKQEMNDLNGTLKMAMFGIFGFMSTLLIAFLTGVVAI